MKVLLPWILLVPFAFVGAAPPTGCTHKVKESIVPPRRWTKQGPAPPDAILELRIALPQHKFSELEKHLYEIRSVVQHAVSHQVFLSQHVFPAILSMIVTVNISPRKKLMNF